MGLRQDRWGVPQARHPGGCHHDQNVAATTRLWSGAETLRAQTVRAECLDWTLVLGRRHLLRILRAYVRHYNQQRPHRGLALAVPEPQGQNLTLFSPGKVGRRDVLGGLIHEYHAVAA